MTVLGGSCPHKETGDTKFNNSITMSIDILDHEGKNMRVIFVS